MILAGQTQPLIDGFMRLGHDYGAVVVTGLGAAALVMAFRATRKPRPEKPSGIDLSETSPHHEVGVPDAAADHMRALLRGKEAVALPLPTAEDLAWAREALGVAAVASKAGWDLYFEARKVGDLSHAMAGLRLYTRYIAEGGDQKPWSPSGEYENLGEAYRTLADTHESRDCLELAHDAYAASYLSLYPEPATESKAQYLMLTLDFIKAELKIRPGT